MTKDISLRRDYQDWNECRLTELGILRFCRHLLLIINMLFTTALNTGRIRGACPLLEQLNKNFLNFHVDITYMNWFLKSALESCIAAPLGPETLIFKSFRKAWIINRCVQFR